MPIETIEIVNTAQWMALRAQDVTASDVAACCGVSPYKTPLKLYAEKVGLVTGGEETNAMRRGRWLEPAGLFALKETYPDWEIRKANVYVRDSDFRIGATPDIVAAAPDRRGLGNVQMKTVAARVFKEWQQPDGSIEVPLHYQLQTLTEAKLMSADWAAVLAFVVGEFATDIHIIDVPIHEVAWERIKGSVRQFWWHVSEGIPPSVEPTRDGTTLRQIYQKDSGEVVDLSADNNLPLLLEARSELLDTIKQSEAEKAEIETEIMARMKDASEGTVSGWKITWKMQHTKEYTVKARDNRVLRITKQKEKA